MFYKSWIVLFRFSAIKRSTICWIAIRRISLSFFSFFHIPSTSSMESMCAFKARLKALLAPLRVLFYLSKSAMCLRRRYLSCSSFWILTAYLIMRCEYLAFCWSSKYLIISNLTFLHHSPPTLSSKLGGGLVVARNFWIAKDHTFTISQQTKQSKKLANWYFQCCPPW